MRKICILFALIYSIGIHAQHEWDTWYFGARAGLNFSTDIPTILNGGKINTKEGCSSISDKETGEFLFYSDGITVWNRNHQVMQNGSGLKGHFSASQSSVIVPRPGHPHKYYLFTADNISDVNGYYYNEIDMTLDNGNGGVLADKKNMLLYRPNSEKLTALKHCNGIDYWVITHKINSKDFYVYLVTQDGVSSPIIQSLGSFIIHGSQSWEGAGNLNVSQNGKLLSHCIGPHPGGQNAKIEIFDFDNSSGILSMKYVLDDLGGVTRCVFSPLGKYLYVSTGQGNIHSLFQFDLNAGNSEVIKNSKYQVYNSSPNYFGDMQITPYGDMYVSELQAGNPHRYLSVIHNPDEYQDACNFEHDAVDLFPNHSLVGLPNFIANVNYNPPIGKVEQTLCNGQSITVNGTIYNQNNPNGVEYLPITASTGCDSVVVVNLTFDNPTGNFTQTICPGQSITIENTTFNQSNPTGQVIIPNGAVGGCDSIINVNITFDATAVSTSIFETELCHEDEITINGTVYNVANPSGTEIIPNGAVGGCDSVIQVNIIFLDTPTGQYENSYCQGDEVEINGTIYNENHTSGIEIIENGSSKGCDSTTFVNLTFDGVFTVLNPVFCPNDAIEINGTIYDESNPIGTEIFVNGSAFGCDSTVEINLQFYNDTAFIDTVFCNLNDSLVLGNQIFTIDNPNGQFALPNASFIGCDSIIDVHVLYQIDSNLVVDTLCWYDSLFVNGHIYTAKNPFGIENMKSLDGCDSIVDLRLFFPYESVDLEIIGPDTVCYGETVILNGNSNLENPSYDWYKNDSLICENCPDVESRVIKTDVFSLFAKDEYGCELFLDQHRIQTKISYDVYFPNAITPNGDGINDKFTIYGTKKVDKVISLAIYDRWGEEVFYNENFPVNKTQFGWNGYFDGKVMQPGVYVYVVFVEFIDGTVKEYAGDLTILL